MLDVTDQRFLVSMTIGIILVLYLRRRGQKLGTLPPGPKGIPFLGNAFQLDTKKIWNGLEIWRKEYGPLVYLNLAGQSVIVVSSQKVATDLFERRSANYSSRPRNIVGGEYISGGYNIFLLKYGDMWRRMRRSSMYALGPRVASQYQAVQSDESILLAHDMLQSPKNWNEYIHRATGSSILSLVYSFPPIRSLNDPTIAFMNDFISRFAQALCPGAYAVEFLPILDYVPTFLAKWKRDATKDFDYYTATFERLFNTVKESILKGDKEQTNFCATLLKPEAKHGLNDRESAWLAACLYVAGYETSTSTLGWIIFCMLLFPEVQQKAQEELDRVVGRSRLPTFADAKHLPYIRAVIREVLRWRPPTPISIPHATVDDDYYENQFIPKGSLCIANVWSMNRDREVYGDDVDDFRPERHLDFEGNLKDPSGEGHYTYGFGQRECAGRHVANNTLFIDTAMILWAMRIEPPRDDAGKAIIPNLDEEKTDGVTLHPPDFEVMTVPRFDQALELLQQARDEVILGLVRS